MRSIIARTMSLIVYPATEAAENCEDYHDHVPAPNWTSVVESSDETPDCDTKPSYIPNDGQIAFAEYCSGRRSNGVCLGFSPSFSLPSWFPWTL